jgi:hypothetical protein
MSSRRIARSCAERLDFMAVAAMQRPDFRTIAKFRRRHLKALGDLFVQVLRLCRKADIANLGHVALDSTKMKANASKHKAMSYGRMQEAIERLEKEVASWFKRAEAEDAAEERDLQAKDELPIRHDLRATPTEVSADAGYCSEENLAVLERRRIRGYVSTGRKRHKDSQTTRGLRPPKAGSRVAAMDARLKRGGWSTRYRLRKCTVEPVFGQIKHGRGFRQFHLRGVDGVRGEWSLLCTAHNLLKLAASRRLTPTPARRSAPWPSTPSVDGTG